MSIQTVKVFHISEIIFEMKLISFAFVQVIQQRVVFAVIIAKYKNSSLRRKPYNYRRNIVFHGALRKFAEILCFFRDGNQCLKDQSEDLRHVGKINFGRYKEHKRTQLEESSTEQ